MGRNVVKVLLMMLMAAALAVGSPGARAAEAAPVQVGLPAFTVTLNGAAVDSAYSQYPLIVYRDITYFPMTYNDCRCLGVETQWSSQTGLIIEQTGVTAARAPYVASQRNAAQYDSAAIVSGPVKVNGKAINNAAEEYPLLLFRDITYFPLTWRFAVDEFGWEYGYDDKRGLVITSDNVTLEQVPLPADRDSGQGNAVTVAKGYMYYNADAGRIMQVPLAGGASKMVYQLPQLILRGSEPGPSKYVPFRLYNHGGEAMLHYSQSAGISGRDYTIRLNADGSFTEAAYHSIVNTFGDKAFSFSAAADYGANNLKMKVGNGEYRDVGDPAYVFGWSWQGGRAGTTPVDAVELVGDELYILGYDWSGADALNGLYRVNINTNATTRVTPRHVLYFQRDGDYLYYASGEGARSYEGHDGVYRYSLKDGREELVLHPAKAPAAIKNIAVLNGHVYWQGSDTTALYDAKGAALNPGGICESMAVVGDKQKYLACTFEETPDSRYRLMVFDRSGGLAFKTSDVAYPGSIVIEGRELYYYNIATKAVCHHALP